MYREGAGRYRGRCPVCRKRSGGYESVEIAEGWTVAHLLTAHAIKVASIADLLERWQTKLFV